MVFITILPFDVIVSPCQTSLEKSRSLSLKKCVAREPRVVILSKIKQGLSSVKENGAEIFCEVYQFFVKSTSAWEGGCYNRQEVVTAEKFPHGTARNRYIGMVDSKQ